MILERIILGIGAIIFALCTVSAHASTPGDSKYWTPELLEWKIKEQINKRHEPEQVTAIDGSAPVVQITSDTHDQFIDMPVKPKTGEKY